MISLLLLQAALGPIGQQALPATGCAAYLWSITDRQLVAMAQADPALLRVQLDGKVLDLARTTADAPGPTGLPAVSRYVADGVSATVEMAVIADQALLRGARVPSATLTVERAGKDMIVAPLAGLVGCAEERK